MNPQYICEKDNRPEAVRNSSLNGIDFIEVASVDQKKLEVHFLKPLPTGPSPPALTKANVQIEGGRRVRNIQVSSVAASSEKLTVMVNARGDFSFYTLRIVTSPNDASTPAGFDPQLAAVEFSFKAGCPSEFDCQETKVCPPEKRTEPEIDYLAKDYASFRRLMLERMSAITPDWAGRNAADGHVALVELLAYVGDHLSYHQDAVATEAYLGTARERISLRRHARLLDYFMHDGANARTWLFLEANASFVVKKKTGFATKGEISKHVRPDGAVVFETMHDVAISPGHNRISFHTWSDAECCLPKGATRATLKNDRPLALKAGDFLLLEEIRDPIQGNIADADPAHRHVVRLSKALPALDLVEGVPVLEIEWAPEDALPFPLCVSHKLREISVARGNIVLADHGLSIGPEPLGSVSAGETYRPFLDSRALSQAGHARNEFGRLVLDSNGRPVPFDPMAPAAQALRWELRDTLPAVELTDNGNEIWLPLPDLLEAEAFTRSFVVEIDEMDRAQLRFGDDILGRKPSGSFLAAYRVGNGPIGNVGAESIVRPVAPISGLDAVRNPLPAQGGCDPESMEEVRQYAPQAFRVQERAVTEADWAEVTERDPAVQKAAARFRWTGSWITVFLTVDRRGGAEVDKKFSSQLRARLERYRIAGYDLEVRGPKFVPLDLALFVCARPGYFASEVKKSLLAVFSHRDLPDGRRGFFHQDNFTFGQPLYLSQVYRVAMEQPGVASVEVRRFQRWGEEANGEMDAGFLRPAALEIVRLDNDRNFPENGRIELEVRGGL